jgi:hypothetical protein
VPFRALLLLILLLAPLAALGQKQSAPPDATDDSARNTTVPSTKHRHFHWSNALAQTAIFLSVEHTLNLKNYLGIPHDHFFRRYADSVRAYHFDRWNDGSHTITNYAGHPFSGAIVGFIQVQNDPAGWQPASTGAYWKSRLKAVAWTTAYSIQWEIGPLSESSLGNYGLFTFRDGSGRLVNSTGLVDLVMTPVGGLGWMLAEDWLDRRFLISSHHRPNTVLCIALNPARTSANLLRLKRPCHRDVK